MQLNFKVIPQLWPSFQALIQSEPKIHRLTAFHHHSHPIPSILHQSLHW
jgi:hypothetical protein